MQIVVCVRQGRDGELSPFDACAYEAALRIPNATVTLVSMGPEKTGNLLLRLTRLGAQKAILLCDRAFAGADTLATAYTLSLAIEKLHPDLILCGRQTLEGDTAQVGPMLSVLAGYQLITNAMTLQAGDAGVTCTTRDEGDMTAAYPALVTVERINTLRLPSIRSKVGTVEMWNAEMLGADVEKCGLTGSPTRVLSSKQNEAGKRRCTFITADKLAEAIQTGLEKNTARAADTEVAAVKLPLVCTVGDDPRAFAETVGETVTVLEKSDADTLITEITALDPDAVIWGSDAWSKRVAAVVCAKMGLGLCADCTKLDADGETLFMIRPALSGSVIAKIKSITRPAMATVRTVTAAKDVVVCAGFGAKDDMDTVRDFAQKYNAELAATRRMVDNGILPYAAQVGLTGRTVAPPLYIALGVSGAVHHIVGMQQAGTVIAVNPDKQAPIFDYADFGIVGDIDTVLS